MTSSAPNRHNGVLFDTNVLSRFAKTECLHLLLQAFSDLHRAQQLYISPAIHHELEAGLQSGITYLRKVLQLVEDGELQIVHPTSADQQFIKSLPSKLAIGEAEAIALSYRLCSWCLSPMIEKPLTTANEQALLVLNLSSSSVD